MFRRTLLMLSLAMAAGGMIAVLVRGMARDVLIIPLLRLLWDIVQLIEGLPQVLVWGVVTMAALVLMLRSLGSPPTLRLTRRTRDLNPGRVAVWARLAIFARRERYSRWRMAQRVALLAQELIAQREGVDLRRARQLIEAGAGLAPEVHQYLVAGLGAYRPPDRLLARLRRRTSPDPLAIDPLVVTAALEQIGGQG
jgi:hypothetical protein